MFSVPPPFVACYPISEPAMPRDSGWPPWMSPPNCSRGHRPPGSVKRDRDGEPSVGEDRSPSSRPARTAGGSSSRLIRNLSDEVALTQGVSFTGRGSPPDSPAPGGADSPSRAPQGEVDSQELKAFRRKISRWTAEETSQLIHIVTIYGKGKWKQVLEAGNEQGIFLSRTSVDLKDKWRNLERARIV